MKKGDKIIWDSGFGYELGYFIEESDHIIYNTYKVKLDTGITNGKEQLREKQSIILYNIDNYNKMVNKYKYEKHFR